MAKDGENARYLPGASFPSNLKANPDLEACLDGVRDVLVVVPSHGLRGTLTKIKPLLSLDSRVCWATKGFELHSGKLPHQVAAEVLGLRGRWPFCPGRRLPRRLATACRLR